MLESQRKTRMLGWTSQGLRKQPPWEKHVPCRGGRACWLQNESKASCASFWRSLVFKQALGVEYVLTGCPSWLAMLSWSWPPKPYPAFCYDFSERGEARKTLQPLLLSPLASPTSPAFSCLLGFSLASWKCESCLGPARLLPQHPS